MPRDMVRTQRSMARRWTPRNPSVMRRTRGVLATRSYSLAVVDEDSDAPSLCAKSAASSRPATTSTKRRQNCCFRAVHKAGSSSIVSVIRQRR